ncbi:tRNA(Glu)-specific nuclease WapA precursor [Stieleria maiorica]|uniref:tRNA(Glu)-specific nuclease WapA n=1 Tax=Stieleria maiorica TaxID=2795974 RepID=A0A5B9MDA4_9BACT|nr:FG-GAP-like repeat-containing protein [Stieleria maiorica]QEF99058.1 tRNA(Glu)-specific nuclease WapA precursor [Stieleria maiorica]
MLAAAIWHNVLSSLDVNDSGSVSPLDALVVLNEIARGAYVDANTGELDSEVPDDVTPPFIDVNCDSLATPRDALFVLNNLAGSFFEPQFALTTSGAISDQSGRVVAAGCHAQLVEGDSLRTEITTSVPITRSGQGVRLTFDAPEFDRSSDGGMQDAVEISVTDGNGQTVTQTYTPDRQSAFNWSENTGLATGSSSAVAVPAENSGQPYELTVNLAHLPVGEQVDVTVRLVNNDGDSGTSVVVRDLEIISGLDDPSEVYASPNRSVPNAATIDFDSLVDISSSVQPSYGRTSYSTDRSQVITELVLTNRSNQTIAGDVVIVLDQFTNLDLATLRPDGLLPDGRPFFNLTSFTDGPLGPGESTRAREVRFTNPGDEPFRYRLLAFGDLNRAPERFTSTPIEVLQSGDVFRYSALAIDPDGDRLTYSLVAGHSTGLIDATTGRLTWQSTSAEIGSNRFTVRATDPYGLFVDQTFDLEVRDDVQNRPPNFVTDPVTEAIASSGFEITTVGVGAGPLGAAIISGFQGPRLVTANSDDQTIGIYAGENNGRFDDVTTYATGHPRRMEQLIDVGITLDAGIPEAQHPLDAFQVRNIAQGDFDLDGNLDLVAAYNFDLNSDSSVGTTRVVVLFGDGNGEFAAPLVLSEYEISDADAELRAVTTGDINNDGVPDIVFNERHAGGFLATAISNGDGTFQPVNQTVYDELISDFVLADIDLDGNLDLFGRTILSEAFGATDHDLFWSRGNGGGTFESPNEFRGTRRGGLDETTKPYDLADLDGDGDLDLVISGDNQLIQVFHNDGSGEFTLVNEIDPPSAQAFYGPDWLIVADFTGDGINDIAFHHVWESRIDLLIGDGNGIDFTHQQGSRSQGRPDNWTMDFEPMDVDGDGDLDIVHGVELARAGFTVGLNDGSGNFDFFEYAIPELSNSIKRNETDATVRGALFGDYNADGVLDVSYFTTDNNFSGQTDAHGIGIRFGTRPGEFGNTRAEPWVDQPRTNAVYHGDFNGDDIVDLFDSLGDVVTIGNGDGSFQEPVPASGIRRPAFVAAVGDYNLDGLDDVVAGREGGLYVGLSNGDGTLDVNQTIDGGGFYGYHSMEAVDFNRDGYLDFIVKAEVDEYFEVYLNDPLSPGTFTINFTYNLADGSQGINVSNWEESWDVGDFNGDGIQDFLTAERESNTPLTPINLVLFAGDGEGGFTRWSESEGFEEFKQFGVLGQPVDPGDLSSGDIDGDGDLDVLSASTLGTRIFLNDGNGNFAFSGDLLTYVRTHQRHRESWLVDFDEDGHLDFVIAAAADIVGAIHVFKGDGQGNFAVAQSVNMHGEANSTRDPFVDWNHDGHLDYVYATGDSSSDDVAFYMGRRDDLVDVLAVDLNGDGNEEILGIQDQMERLQIFVGDSLGRFSRQQDLQTGRSPKALAAGDLDGNGMEIVAANRSDASLSIFSGDLASGFSSSVIDVPGRPIDVELADHDGDGEIDIFVLDEMNGLHVYAGNGTLVPEDPASVSLGDRPGRMLLADANGDGALDVVITLPESQRIMILPGDGATLDLGAPIYLDLDEAPADLAVLNLNDDAHPDIAIALPFANAVAVYYGLGSGQFARPQSITVGDSPTRIVSEDADEDGRMDLIVTNTGDDTVSVIYNRFDPNEVYRYDSDAVDPDDDILTYAIVDGPRGLIINPANGALLWAASPDQVGVHDVVISADDGRGGVGTQTFKIEVVPAEENASPLIALMPEMTIAASESFTHTIQAIDADHHPLRFRLLQGPDGASINPTSGELIWDGRSQAEEFGRGHAGGIIRIPSAATLKPESITVEGWYQLKALTRFNILVQDQGILVTTHETDQSIRVDLSLEGETLRFFVPVTPKRDEWYHLAFTYDAATGEAKLFVDGVLGGSATASEPKPLNTTPGVTQVGIPNGTMRAVVDNYRIWDDARDEQEIRDGMDRQFEGDPRLVVDYRFEETDTITVRDHSIYGNHGYRIAFNLTSQPAVGLADPGRYDFTVGVEDGRGGFDVKSFTIDVAPEIRGSIEGKLFEDLDGDGVQDDGSENPAEPGLADWHLFIDQNENGFPDPGERQAITDSGGNYAFPNLLTGDYRISVSPVAGYQSPPSFEAEARSETLNEIDPGSAISYDLAIEQLALSQIRGQLKTESDQPIPYWKVFADLNEDGFRDTDEPMAMSDRFGNFAVTGLGQGNYKLLADKPAGWSDAAEVDGLMVELGADEISEGNDFVLSPTNSSVTAGLHFVTTAPESIEARRTLTYASIALSISEGEVRYDLSLAPDGMVVDPTTGLLAWRPTVDQVGEHTIVLRAKSGDSVALQDFIIDVTAPNEPPVVTRLPGDIAHLNQPHQFDIAAQDDQQETLTFALLGPSHGASVDFSSGRMTWTPGATGSFAFLLEVTDGSGASTREEFTIQVDSAAPVLELVDVRLPRDQFPVGQQSIARISAMDSLGRDVDWTINSPPTGMTVQVDGTIEWTPTGQQLGEHTLMFVAVTAGGTSFPVEVPVSVVGSLVNSKPVVRSSPITAAVVGSPYSYDLVVDDPDRDPLSFALLEAPHGMSLDPIDGTVRWTPAEDQRREHSVVIRIADTYGAEVLHSYKLTTRRFGGPPVIESVPETEASVGQAYFYTIEARDAEKDPLTYRLLTAPDGMSITESTGAIVWTPIADQVGLQTVAIEVSDGVGGASTQSFAIRVGQGVANTPPTINSSAPRFAAVGSTYRYPIVAADPEQTQLSYLIATGPAGMTITTEGLISWMPGSGAEGKVPVTIRVIDEGGAAAIESFEIDVLAENLDPIIESSAPSEAVAGAVFRYDLFASDPNVDLLTYELTVGPALASIDAFGRIRWTPTSSDLGDHPFEVTVRDPRGGVAIQSFDLEVIEDTVPPRVSLIERPNDTSRNVLPWQGPFVVYAKSIDNVEVASLTLTANGQSIPLDAAGTATFNFEDWAFQTINATATAVDTSGNETSRTITFNYDFPEGWGPGNDDSIPTATITSPADSASVTGMVSIAGTASHEDFSAYRLSYRRIDDGQFTQFLRSETPVENGELGVWDTSLLPNDEYVIRLEVATTEGVANVAEHRVGLAGELKLGNFRLSFTDMVIPVAGIPIEITRIYDTLQADRQGDFGFGWRLEYRDTDLRVGLPKSGLEDIGIYSGLRPGVKVYLNIPGQGRQGFTFDPDIRVLPGWGGNNLVLARPRFTPDPGVTATLSTGISNYLHVNEQGELYAPGGIPYNPASPNFGGAYVVTTRDGISYRVDGATGKLVSATDRNGNSLTFADGGISSGNQFEVSFDRNASGRIARITDLEGQSVEYFYGAAGDLTRVVDREGNSTEFTYLAGRDHYLDDIIDPLGRVGDRLEYDSDGRLISTTNVRGAATSYSFDPDNFVGQVTGPLGEELLYEYDQFGNVVSTTDALGNQIRHTFDAEGRVIATVDSLGNRTSYTRNQAGDPIQITDAAGNVIRFAYNAMGDLESIIDAIGSVERRRYDDFGNLIARTAPDGATIHYEYDSRGNRIRTTDAIGRSMESVFDSFGNEVTQIDRNGNALNFAFNANGVTTGSFANRVDHDGTQVTISTQITVDSNGQWTAARDPLGNVSQREFNALGQLQATVDPMGRRVEMDGTDTPVAESVLFAGAQNVGFDFDLDDQLTSVTNKGGFTEKYVYDAVGNLIQRILPDGTDADESDNPIYVYEYDALRRVTATVDPNGHRTEFEYDSVGNQIAAVDAMGNESRWQYDAAGRVTAMTDRLQRKTSFRYDAVGRLLETTFPDSSSIKYQYDRDGNRIGIIDADGNQTRYRYDNESRLTEVINVAGNTTSYERDSLGNVTKNIDALGRETRFEYDVLSNPIKTTRPLGQTSTRTYYADSQLESETDFVGNTKTYTYGDRGELRRIDFSDGGNIEYEYDDFGNPVRIIDSVDGTSIASYNERAQLVEMVRPDGSFLRYSYDLAGNLVSLTTPNGTAVYEYDSLNRMISAEGSNGAITRYTYDAEGNVSTIDFGNGTEESRGYDALDRLVFSELRDALGTVLSRTDYTREPSGNITEIHHPDGSITAFQYDQHNRLIEETRRSLSGDLKTVVYSYDAVGNRVAKTDSEVGMTLYEYDNNDRLIQVSGAEQRSYQYNANGQQLSASDSNGGVIYQWNGRGQLESAEVTAGTTTTTVGYAYDASGNLVRRTVDGLATNFLVDANRDYSEVIEEYGDLGNVVYLYGNERISHTSNGETVYYHSDHQDSITSIHDDSGQLVASGTFDAFGLPLENTVDLFSPFGFTGQYTDDVTGNVYLRARHMDPVDGRFLSEDPYAGVRDEPTSLHRFLYAHNNPVAYTDPSGEVTIAQTIVTVGLIGGLLGLTTLVGRQLFEATASVNWKGFSGGVSGGPSAVVVSASAGMLASAVATENAPFERKVSWSDDYQRRYSGLMGTILAGVSGGLSTPVLDLSGGIGTFELELPRPLTPRIAPTLGLVGAFLMYDSTVTVIAGKTFSSFLAMGYGAGGANGCGLGTPSAADTVSSGVNLVLPTGETNRQNTGQIRDAFGLANVRC